MKKFFRRLLPIKSEYLDDTGLIRIPCMYKWRFKQKEINKSGVEENGG